MSKSSWPTVRTVVSGPATSRRVLAAEARSASCHRSRPCISPAQSIATVAEASPTGEWTISTS